MPKRKIVATSRAVAPNPVPVDALWPNRWLSVSLLALTFAALTVWSWRKWPDVLVDFGQQLYIPWRLAGGEHLYKDIALMHGPLSQYVNAFWFWVFGPSLTVLVVVNLVVLAGLTAILCRVIRAATDRLTALIAGVLFLCVFGFSQYLWTGNYNFVAPYTHESTHGMLLTAGMVLLLTRYVARRRRADLVLAGVCFGLALLTKIDIALAAAAIAVAGLAAAWLARRENTPLAIDALGFGLAAAAPVVAFFCYFLSYLPARAALAAVTSGFSVMSSQVADNPFYQRVLGFDDVGGNLASMIAMFAWILGAVLAAATVDAAAARMSGRPHRVGAVLGMVLLATLLWNLDAVPWNDLQRALPLTSALALIGFTWLVWRDRADPARQPRYVAMLLWSVWALALLSKMVLNARIAHYGFYLAMPATVLLAVTLIWWIPRGLRASIGNGSVFRALAFAMVAAAVVFQLRASDRFYRVKTFQVGSGGDAMLTYPPNLHPMGFITADALRWINANMPTKATFVALPEGIMLNYLSRRPTTSPVINLMMTEEIIFGEPFMVAAFERRPPDYVVLVDKNTAEFGVGPFGADPQYGHQIMEWVDRRYQAATLIGDEPFTDKLFGVKVLRRITDQR